MKKRNVQKVTIISLLIIIIVCAILIVLQKEKISRYQQDINLYQEKINKIESQVNEEPKEEEKYYDCSFTQTYRIVNLLDGYVAEVPEKSYVIVDKFQSHYAYAHPIITNLKDELEVDNYYEFTYHIKGKGIINDISDVTNYISEKKLEDSNDGILRVNLSVKKTDKKGMEQIQEDICKGE